VKQAPEPFTSHVFFGCHIVMDFAQVPCNCSFESVLAFLPSCLLCIVNMNVTADDALDPAIPYEMYNYKLNVCDKIYN